MQRQQVQHHQGEQHDRQRNHVQGEEAVQGHAGNQVVATNPGHQVLTDHRNGTEQRNDHLRAPVGHLAPGQYVADEGLGHQHDKNQHAEDPDQLARLLVRAVNKCPEHVQVDHHKESGGTRGVHIAQNPAVIDITHDVFDRGESLLGTGGVVHGEPDTGQQLVNQNQQ